MNLDDCEAIFAAINSAVSEDALRARYRKLLQVYPILRAEYESQTIWRGRKCNSDRPYENVRNLGYPNPSECKVGRFNSEGRPAFYGATSIETIFSELNLRENDFLHVIGVRPKPSESFDCFMIGKLYDFYKTGDFPGIRSDSDSIMSAEDLLLRYDSSLNHEDMKRIVFIDKFLAKILSDPEAPAENYMRTHCLALEVFRKIPHAAGFYYPSVRDTGGTCVALMPTTYDKNMKIVSAKFLRITRTRSLGFYDHEVCLEATNVSQSGEFIWRKPTSEFIEHCFNLTEEERDELEEWNQRLLRRRKCV